MRFVVQHGGRVLRTEADEVIPYDGNGQAGRADIFLSTEIQYAEIVDIIYLGQDVAGSIRHQRHARRQGGQRIIPRTVNGVVGNNVRGNRPLYRILRGRSPECG